jgi:hypothetical protein
MTRQRRRGLHRARAALIAASVVMLLPRAAPALDCAEISEQEGGFYGYTSLGDVVPSNFCPDGSPVRVVTLQTFRCSDGASNACTPPQFGGAFPDHSPCDGPVRYNFCTQCNQPGCKEGVTDAGTHPTKDPAKEVGDPIDLATGALKQTATDLDLGGGLRFTRHYSSGFEAANRALETAMGAKWRHGLQWSLSRETGPDGEHVVHLVQPFGQREVFVIDEPALGGGFEGSNRGLGSLAGDFAGELTYTSPSGTKVVFDASDRVTSIAIPGERTIEVSYAGSTATYSNGNASLTVSHYASGFQGGKVHEVSGGGVTVTYGYVLHDFVQYDLVLLVQASSSDGRVWDYDYTPAANSSAAQLRKVTRTDASGSDVLGEWTYSGNFQIASADEDALDQKLKFWYGSDSQQPTLEVTKVCEGTAASCNAQSPALATVTSNGAIVRSISGLGGPGYQPRIASAAPEANRWKTRTDPNGNTTLYEDYDPKGRPGRIVEGWVDADSSGSFTAGDGVARVAEYTWHPRLNAPLTVTRPSTTPGQPDAVTVFDYDDDGGAGAPNAAPTDRVHARIESGATLDEGGVAQPVAAITRFTYL